MQQRIEPDPEALSRPVRPLIGILTQPVTDAKKTEGYDFDEYILAVNYDFVKLTGSEPVYISYLSDTPEDHQRLMDTLEQINGVLFTGGNLTLVDKETGEQHPYYRTSKKIIDYSRKQKDQHNIDFPLLCVC